MTREEAIAYGKRVIGLGLNDETQAFCELAIEALQERKTGKWIIDNPYSGLTHCSECGGKEDILNLSRYCPYCGAKMEVDE